jgi:hypothetical protein
LGMIGATAGSIVGIGVYFGEGEGRGLEGTSGERGGNSWIADGAGIGAVIGFCEFEDVLIGNEFVASALLETGAGFTRGAEAALLEAGNGAAPPQSPRTLLIPVFGLIGSTSNLGSFLPCKVLGLIVPCRPLSCRLLVLGRNSCRGAFVDDTVVTLDIFESGPSCCICSKRFSRITLSASDPSSLNLL